MIHEYILVSQIVVAHQAVVKEPDRGAVVRVLRRGRRPGGHVGPGRIAWGEDRRPGHVARVRDLGHARRPGRPPGRPGPERGADGDHAEFARVLFTADDTLHIDHKTRRHHHGIDGRLWHRAMAAAPGLGGGRGHGPLNHFVPAPPRPPTEGL